MDVIAEIQALQMRSDAERVRGHRVGLVPTMGALHEGHLSLVAEARRRSDRVWVSIFVNPTQFNDAADLERYPRTLAADLEACRQAGVDAVFTPSVEAMYPEGHQTTVDVAQLTTSLCGASRPGHFRGVTTVVTKLLMAARPHVAVFGQKDFQQLAVIRRMVRDLHIGVEIVAAPTVREADGVALSSRNQNLDPEARSQAVVLVRALEAAEAAVAAGERDAARLTEVAMAEIRKAPRAAVDYVELREPESLEPAGKTLVGPTLLALAVDMRPSRGRGSGVRLIDNRVLVPGAMEAPD